jgi:hypothetical protein
MPTRLIIDIATNRVTYFTEDMEKPLALNSHLAMRDWLEPLPENMKLNNCWNWRVTGNTLENTVLPPTTPESLLDQNKKSVEQLLIDKINDARRPYFNKNTGQEWIREQRLNEARIGSGPLLLAEAEATNIDILTLAHDVITAHRTFSQVMIKTEERRIRFQKAIKDVTDESTLWQLRDEIANTDLANLSS